MTVLMILGFTTQVFAQEYRGDDGDDYFTYSVSGGYGFGSVPQIATALLESIAFAYTAPFTGSKKIETKDVFGPVFAGADYYFNDNFSCGGMLVCDTFTRRWTFDNGYTDWNWSFLSLMGRLNLQYGWEYVKFYHSLMIGGSRVGIELEDSDGNSHSSSEYTWAGHLALLGIRIGKEFSVFADIGVGYLGIVNFGASISF